MSADTLTLRVGPDEVTILTTGTTGPASPGVPVGGTVGQVAVKLSSTDFHLGWTDIGTQVELDAETAARIAADVAEAATRGAADTAESAARVAGDALLVPLTQKGAASGVATLDGATTIPLAQIPASIARSTWPPDSADLGGADRQRSSSRQRVRYEDGVEFKENDWTTVGFAPWVGFDAAYNSVSAGKLMSQYDGGDPTTFVDQPFPVAATETFRMVGIINVAATPVSPGSSALYTMVGVKHEAAHLSTVVGFVGIGVNELNQPSARVAAESSAAQVMSETPLAAGVWYVTLDINLTTVSVEITNADRSVVHNRMGLRSVALTSSVAGQVCVINRDSRKTAGNSIGAVFAKKEAATARMTATVTANKAGPVGILTSPTVDTAEGLRIMVPPSYDSRVPTPLVMWTHGTGRDSLVPGNANTFDLFKALSSDTYGYLMAAGDLADDSWGNQAGLDAFLAHYRHMRDQFNIGPVLLLAASMGGLVALNVLARADVPGIAGFYGMYPVTNLGYQYATSPNHPALIRAAYSFVDPDYAAATAGHDPMLRHGREFRGVRVRMSASAEDVTVDKANNADVFAALVAPYAPEASVLVGSGAHGDVTQTDVADVHSFFKRCLGIT